MDAEIWNKIVASFPTPHILQTWQWGAFKSQYGWNMDFKVWGRDDSPDAAALVLQRTMPLGGFSNRLRIIYVPKGPLLRAPADLSLVKMVLEDLRDLARSKRAIFIKIDPDILLARGMPGIEGEHVDPSGIAWLKELKENGWRYSNEQVQFRNTVLVDLAPSEDELLARMKQKTRYNIRLASRKGVNMRLGGLSDFDLLYQMYAETAWRDGFVIRDRNYYKALWQMFNPQIWDSQGIGQVPACQPIIAEVDEEPVAAVVVFRFAGIAYYMHGMSRPIHRDRMPNYVLQWEAMRRAKAAGCRIYDLWGAPDIFEEGDPMWGVFRFKQGLGGEVWRTIGAYDLPIYRSLYELYTGILPRILSVMRRRSLKRTQMSI